MLRVLDLFAGIGGFSLGLERAGGFETVGFCERDEYCQHVLAKHWPGVPCHGDVTTREFQEGEADVVTGGFPCQDLSYAGFGAGLAGARSGLWGELVRAIRVVRPLYAIVENVAALLDRGMGVVLGDLADIGNDAEWDCISACSLGATHMRRRVFIVAYPHGVDGRPRLWHPPSRPHGKVQALDCFPGARAGAKARLADPSALYGGADGLPNGSHRNRAIGNSIYPPIATLIGNAIKAAQARGASQPAAHRTRMEKAMSEDEFEAAVGRIERDHEDRGADLTDVYLIVNWARKSRQLLSGAAEAFSAIAESGVLPREAS